MGVPIRTAIVACLWPLCLPLYLGCASDDSDSCNANYLADLIDFTFTPTITQAGNYVVGIESPPVSGSCSVVVGSTELTPCSSARMIIDGYTDEGVVALSSLQLWFTYAPATISLTVQRDEVTLLSQQFEPNYVTEYPEGHGCQSRLHASIPLELP